MELQEVKRSETGLDKDSYFIKDESVMTSALDVFTNLSSNKRIVLLAKGNLIPNAVAVANIVTENMLKGNSKIQDIKLDSVISEEDGQMISNIEIILIKNQ
ncbi:DNA-binding protein [Candidatus Nitrosopelagicus sp.]|jgi:DNA-binding protein|nr:DNA-binding protein [Candidatus Nitrosopelagicus sp.]